MDRARVLAPQARLVVVGPTPEPGREDVSARYAERAEDVCRRHGASYVDAHATVISRGDCDRAFGGSVADGPSPRGSTELAEARSGAGLAGGRALFPYPTGEAMDALATEVLAH
jgi:hypothetical protein